MNRETQDPLGSGRMIREEDAVIVFMPLQKNVPEPRNEWRLTACPKCGQCCWIDLEGYEQVRQIYTAARIHVRCTECALKEK